MSHAITPFKPTPLRSRSGKLLILSPSLICAADGVFGRCQELAGADLHAYQLSSSALQRLRILLQKLARRGTRVCHGLSAFIPRRQVQGRQEAPVDGCVGKSSQRSQAVSLARRDCVLLGRCSARLRLAAILTGSHTGRTLRANSPIKRCELVSTGSSPETIYCRNSLLGI